MKPKSIIIILAVIVVVISVFYSFQSGDDNKAYIKQIEKEREDKDHFMKTASESPFGDHKSEMKGLNYFPVNPDYKIIATLTPIEKKDVVVLTTSDGKEQHYLTYAYAEFDLANRSNKLLILEVMEAGPFRGTLFLAFGDETSARETYGAGRYLDVKKVPGSSTITLDFNLAYNPYCAYSDGFSCPLPPKENLLSIAINAGEKTYNH
ncbi:MAG TPA: DUF1684 domain-containing protein [Cyclobacteriaceae bacterium]